MRPGAYWFGAYWLKTNSNAAGNVLQAIKRPNSLWSEVMTTQYLAVFAEAYRRTGVCKASSLRPDFLVIMVVEKAILFSTPTRRYVSPDFLLER